LNVNSSARSCLLLACLPWLLLSVVTGCSDGWPKRVPVSGQVLIDGKPLEVGFIQVLVEGHRPASGKIGPDSRFTLTTFDQGDGCVPGKHRVVVFSQKSLNGMTTKWFAPKKYANSVTSGLEINVADPHDDVVLHLTWKSSGHVGPFIEKE
jgi:hypothetical protein